MESFWESIINLFAPATCSCCSEPLPHGIEFMCPRCRWDLPITEFWLDEDNKVAQKFWGLIPVEGACSLFYYRQGSNFQRAIHELKYRGYWRTCVEFGEMFARKLAHCTPYNDVDVIVPVPLHRLKLLKRGYNQSEYIAKGLSSIMNVRVEVDNVVRHINNKPQVHSRYKHERWDNVNNIFRVKNPEILAGKHILIVDDVLTTGATICSCAKAIIDSVPNCRVSIVTLAVSDYEMKKFPAGKPKKVLKFE